MKIKIEIDETRIREIILEEILNLLDTLRDKRKKLPEFNRNNLASEEEIPMKTETLARGRPSTFNITKEFIENNNLDKVSLTWLEDKTGIPTATLRNHLEKLGYKYNKDKRIWILKD